MEIAINSGYNLCDVFDLKSDWKGSNQMRNYSDFLGLI